MRAASLFVTLIPRTLAAAPVTLTRGGPGKQGGGSGHVARHAKQCEKDAHLPEAATQVIWDEHFDPLIELL
jgi:hypothetical protein